MSSKLGRLMLSGVSGVGFAALAFAMVPAAFAQAPQTATTSQPSEEAATRVVITAERREQDAQDVPISASIFSGEQLTEQGVNVVNDIQRIAPSVAINTFNRSTFINIRGVGIAQSAPTSNPGVAFYIDGALIPHEQFIGQAFFDIGAIEVLRGPQGTLTGQNSTGGAMYVRTPAPDFTKNSGYIDQTVADYNWYKTTIALNTPFTDTLAMRASFVRDVRDSFTDNIGPSPSNPGDLDLQAGRFNLEWRPWDGGTFNLRYENFNLLSDNNPVKRRGDTVSTNPFVIEEDATSYQNQAGERLSGEARIDILPGMQLRFLTSKQLGTTKDQTDGDRSATALPRPVLPAAAGTNTGRVSFARTEFDTWINEVNLLSTGDGPLQWVAGAFYLDETVSLQQLRDNTSTTVLQRLQAGRSAITQTEAVNTTKSVFGQVEYAFTPQWQVIAGARYSEDQQDYNRIISAGGTGVATQKSNETTGKVAINYKPTEDIMLYASGSKGYKAGGVNLTFTDPNFEPETNVVYEIGAKTELMDGHLRLNADVFTSDYQDIQLASLRAGLPTTQNAASGEATGAELEVLFEANQFTFNAGLGWLDATFAEDACLNNTNAAAGTDPGCSTGNRLVPKGQALPFSPEITLNAGAEYEFLIGDMTLTPRIQYSRVGEQFATPFPSDLTLVPDHDVWDFRLTFRPTDRLLLEAFMTNMFDEVYIASQIQNSSSADGGIIYGAPQQVGARLRYNF
jgi:iron complex outermembrane receptor protein